MCKKNWLKMISFVLVFALLVQRFPLAVRADETLPAELECDPQSGMSALYEYETFDAGMAGTVYLNNYLGTLHLRRSDLTLGGERMPVSIEFYYDTESNSSTSSYGAGWSCVYNQKLTYDQTTGKYAYKNENGTWVYFVNSGTLTDSGNEIWVEDVDYGVGLIGIELYLPETSSETNYPAVDLVYAGVHYSFDTSGRLIRLSNGSNQIGISYAADTSDNIETITDSVGRQFCFTYTNGYLTSIAAKTSEDVAIASTTVSYSVVDGLLTSVAYTTDNVITYVYDTNRRLSTVVNADLCGYTFSYSGGSNVVTTVTNKAALGTEDEESGYQTVFDRSVADQVTITRDTVQCWYTFDGCGRIAGCEMRMKSDAAAIAEGTNTFQCVYGYNLTYGYVTNDDGTITNTVVDMETYDADGVIEDPVEEEEDTTPEETEPSEEDDPYTYTKDAYGNILTETYTDGSFHQSTAYTYSEDGNYLLSKTDENGNTVQYQYDLTSGLLSALVDANQNTTEYTYNAMRELQSVQLDVSGLSNAAGMGAQYQYSGGRLTRLQYGGYTYAFTYDVWGNVTKVTMNGRTLVSYNYGTSAYKGQANTVTYGNNQKVFYTYNSMGQVATVGYAGQLNRFQYTYGTDGSLTQIYDSVLHETTVYTENGFELRNSANSVIYSYSSTEDANYSETINGTAMHSAYDTDGHTKTVTGTSGNNILTSFAGYGVFDLRTDKVNNIAGRTIIQTYNYPQSADKAIGNMVSEYSVGYEQSGLQYLLIYNYTYDGNGNITEVKETLKQEQTSRISGGVEETTYTTVSEYTQSYTYDEAGQLTYARDEKARKSYRYTYNASGNLTGSRTYNISTTGTETMYSRKVYSYSDGILSGITESGVPVSTTRTYQVDAMGNPVTLTVGSASATFTWGEGRMLTGIDWSSGNCVDYEYNADGLRSRKTLVKNGTEVVTEYIWGENGLAGTVTGNNTVIILYDVDGEPVGFTVNGAVYSYIKNIQGDVIQILDSSGNAVVSYSYDPWGVPTVTGNTTLAALNPCSYRGYDYDEETGYYYLQSRYYDPAVGRFLNADDIAFLGNASVVMDYNLFAYCNNSPTNYFDATGYSPLQWICAAIGAIAGWSFGDYVARQLGYSSGWEYWTIRAGVVIGGAVLGWFAASLMARIIARYLRNNPSLIFKLAHSWNASRFMSAMQFLGINPFTLPMDKGKFAAIAQLFNSKTIVICYEWAKQLYYKAQSLGFKIELDSPHGGYSWHLHISGDNGRLRNIHIQITKAAWDFLWNLLH